ncbi:MAG: hypothetical protein AAFY88_22805, partial [Acidobacteriota bacterium]
MRAAPTDLAVIEKSLEPDRGRWLRSRRPSSFLPAAVALCLAAGGGPPILGQAPGTPRPAAVEPGEIAPTRVFREISKRTAPGLPQSTILDMHQDRRGVLWPTPSKVA